MSHGSRLKMIVMISSVAQLPFEKHRSVMCGHQGPETGSYNARCAVRTDAGESTRQIAPRKLLL
jgi:hypothetical protein